MIAFILFLLSGGAAAQANGNGNGNDGNSPDVIVVPGLGLANGPPLDTADLDEQYKGNGVYLIGEDVADDVLETIVGDFPDYEDIPSIEDLPDTEEYREETLNSTQFAGDGGLRKSAANARKVPYGERKLQLSHWSGWVSDGWGGADCPNSTAREADQWYFANGMACRGSWCDDVQLGCTMRFTGRPKCTATAGCNYTHLMGWQQAVYYTNWMSEEGPGTLGCPNGHFVTEVFCSGDFCDDLSFKCEKWSYSLGHTGCWWGGRYSEEGDGARHYAGDNYMLAGIQCSGSYCDTKRNLYCASVKPSR
ncbi:expressed unknown protein [Seminavis robusta]|uniref:Uncharacterized protein n=1 Tax=Seminavis robusta TaxID=568900 RepID=A0A9N8DAE7_9STRA|nr:expressed unknown protein [Seminavis robusta]|eukprot:Sro33_g021660.1 n/a (306) ;mRNA; f:133249-134257